MELLIPRVAITSALFLLGWYPQAHPHVWVAVEATVVYDTRMVTGFRYKWSFDKAYSACEPFHFLSHE